MLLTGLVSIVASSWTFGTVPRKRGRSNMASSVLRALDIGQLRLVHVLTALMKHRRRLQPLQARSWYRLSCLTEDT